ncbi:MAG: oligoendopeptidase F [Candidatus Cellulosilyticum pullistercoris]|uniref:Oligopeptidase F n=1 Tax=Candidatus Cellulosilyticum pullistercoris TaxID=2838521 RepID=A0A9E2KBS0_9FIRM|nr:oligoendopeptidase F [Candidatus Cellulosilyticum pullistercoris]
MNQILPKREEVRKEDQWRLEDIFPTDDAFKTCLEHTTRSISNFKPYENQLTQSSTCLLEFMKMQDQFWVDANKLYVYAHMRLHENGNNSFYQDLAQKSEVLHVKASSALAFSQPELSSLTLDQLNLFYEKTPELKHYKRYFDELLRQKTHILDPATEALLAEVSDVAGTAQNTFSMLNNVDLKFPLITNEQDEKVQLTHATYIPFMESSHREVRHLAFDALYNTYSGFKNTLASLFAGNIKQYGLFSKVRHFNSPLEMALSENNIPTTVYSNLVDTVNAHLHILHDYMQLRKETLGLETLHMYDLFVPMVKDFEKKISFDEAKQTVLKALAPLGEDYIHIVKSAFTEGWIDKYENEGKRSGAYSWGTYGAPHPYILLNHTPNINSMFTLAHEMGHAMHTYYSHKTQASIYGDYCIFVAEVASTVNEALLMQYLLKETSDPIEKQYLINYFMDQFKSTLYRQTMFAEFEHNMHLAHQNGETLTSDYLSREYLALVKKYHGPAVEVDEIIAMEWSRIPHFYTPFYVYQYATGYSAAIALSERLLSGDPSAVEDYIRFLSGGSSADPIELLKIAGVDMSSQEPIEKALNLFNSLIIQFKENQI